jgi:hypothetical protein
MYTLYRRPDHYKNNTVNRKCAPLCYCKAPSEQMVISSDALGTSDYSLRQRDLSGKLNWALYLTQGIYTPTVVSLISWDDFSRLPTVHHQHRGMAYFIKHILLAAMVTVGTPAVRFLWPPLFNYHMVFSWLFTLGFSPRATLWQCLGCQF